MRYNERDTWLRNAFAIVAKTDRRTYLAMQSADWHVSTDIRDVTARIVAAGYPKYYAAIQAYGMLQAFGTTYSDQQRAFAGEAETFVNTDAVESWADSAHIHTATFAADVLVHEFQHIHQHGMGVAQEIPAFQAGSAFAAKLPAPDGPAIKQLSDMTLMHQEQGGATNPFGI